MLALTSCHTSSSTSATPSADTTFTGSYFQYSFTGGSAYAKAFNLTSANVYVDISTNSVGTDYWILLQDPYQLYGSDICQLRFVYSGTGTGTYPMQTYSTGIPSTFMTASLQSYTDTTGTVSVTYSGSDYIQGTFSGTMYGSGLSVPVTGSFKVVH